MPGPKVVSSRPDPGAAQGEFTKAFATVMDALQAAEQAKLLKQQIETQAVTANTKVWGELVKGLIDTDIQRGEPLPDVVAKWGSTLADLAERAGFNRSVIQGRFDEMAKSPLTTPEMMSEAVAGAVSFGLGMQGPPPAQPTSEAAVEQPPATQTTEEAPEEDPWVRMMTGPTNETKTTQVRQRYEEATKAIEQQDLKDPVSVNKATAALTKVRMAAEAGATKEQRRAKMTEAMNDPTTDAYFTTLMGLKWREIFLHTSLGTIPDYLKAQASEAALKANSALDAARMEEILQRVAFGKTAGMPADVFVALKTAEIEADLRRDISATTAETAKLSQLGQDRRKVMGELTDLRQTYVNRASGNQEQARKNYMKDSQVLSLSRQLAEIETELHPGVEYEPVFNTIKEGWWLWKKELALPTGEVRPKQSFRTEAQETEKQEQQRFLRLGGAQVPTKHRDWGALPSPEE